MCFGVFSGALCGFWVIHARCWSILGVWFPSGFWVFYRFWGWGIGFWGWCCVATCLIGWFKVCLLGLTLGGFVGVSGFGFCRGLVA